MSTIVYVAPGQATELGGHATNLLDGMIEAQDDLGQVTWDALSHAVAFGTYRDAVDRRVNVAVFDLDLANGIDVIRVTNWVNNGGEMPELRI